MWAGVVKRLSRFFAFDGVSRGAGASTAAAAAREGGGKRKRGKEKAGAENLKRI